MTETANGRQPAEQAMDALGPAGWKPAPVHAAQARTAGVEITGKVSFRGKDYRLGKYAGENLMALLEFTAAQDAGLGTDDPAGMAAMMDWLRFCFILTPSCGQCEACDDERYAECGKLDEGDWPGFRRRARAVCASGDEILACLNSALAQVSARPTSPPSASSATAPPSSTGSKVTSSPLATQPAELPPAFRAAAEAGDLIDVAAQLRSPA